MTRKRTHSSFSSTSPGFSVSDTPRKLLKEDKSGSTSWFWDKIESFGVYLKAEKFNSFCDKIGGFASGLITGGFTTSPIKKPETLKFASTPSSPISIKVKPLVGSDEKIRVKLIASSSSSVKGLAEILKSGSTPVHRRAVNRLSFHQIEIKKNSSFMQNSSAVKSDKVQSNDASSSSKKINSILAGLDTPSLKSKKMEQEHLQSTAIRLGRNRDMIGLENYRKLVAENTSYVETVDSASSSSVVNHSLVSGKKKESTWTSLFENIHLDVVQHLSINDDDKLFSRLLQKEEEELDQRIESLRLPPKKSRLGSVPKPELPEDCQSIISDAMKKPQKEELVYCNNVPVRPEDLDRLKPGAWLNDEIINFYFNMIWERSKNDPELPELAIQSTFFYSTLKESGYSRVSRYSRKFDVFTKDLYLVPIHLGNHWACACINFKIKRVEYYDSLGGRNSTCIDLLWDWLQQESEDKKKKPFDYTGWTKYCPKNIPHQQNGFDCGVFACAYGEHLSRSAPFEFSQADMPYFRRRIAYEILTEKLLI